MLLQLLALPMMVMLGSGDLITAKELNAMIPIGKYKPMEPMIRTEAPNVGDTVNLWVLGAKRGSGGGHAMGDKEIAFKCTNVGEYCYVMAEIEAIDANELTPAVTDSVFQLFESYTIRGDHQGIYRMEDELWGHPPAGVDGDPKIYLVLVSMESGFGDGYFGSWNELTQDEIDNGGYGIPIHTNLREAIFIDLTRKNVKKPYGVLAHEYYHLINYFLDPDEVTWVTEGFAEFVMYQFGMPDNLIATGYARNPQDPLGDWAVMGQSYEYNKSWVDYEQSYIYMMYLHQLYGDTDLFKAIANEPAQSKRGIENALSDVGINDRYEEIFLNWTIANMLNDSDLDANHRYGYSYPDFAPLPFKFQYRSDVSVLSSDWEFTQVGWAVQYCKISADTGVVLNFSAEANRGWQVWIAQMVNNKATKVEIFDLVDGNLAYPMPDKVSELVIGVVLAKENRTEKTLTLSSSGAPLPPYVGENKLLIESNPYNPNSGPFKISVNREDAVKAKVTIRKEGK